MGRPKTYDRDDVARRAMPVFWRHGYEGTTIQHLEDALAVNRCSLFAEFGSKQGMFEAALEVYEVEVVTPNLAELEREDASPAAVVAMLERFRYPTVEIDEAGCMLCNASLEQMPDSPIVRDQVSAYFDRLRSAFQNALGIDEAAAAAITSAVVGAFVQIRHGMSADARSTMVDGLLALADTRSNIRPRHELVG
ncbi:MAG: helix-turn-helix domain containing protein [bacterium]|nr:helix-turn-helix domain containing protein [bacterium]